MPVEGRLRRDHECRSPLSWDEISGQGDERPVRPGEAGLADLASKDRHLVAQHKDLGVLGERVLPRQLERSEGAMDQAVEEADQHCEQPRRLHPGWARRRQGVSGPFRASGPCHPGSVSPYRPRLGETALPPHHAKQASRSCPSSSLAQGASAGSQRPATRPTSAITISTSSACERPAEAQSVGVDAKLGSRQL